MKNFMAKNELVIPRKCYRFDGPEELLRITEADNSEWLDAYRVGDTFRVDDAAPGHGFRIWTVTRIDVRGLWGRRE